MNTVQALILVFTGSLIARWGWLLLAFWRDHHDD